MGLIRKSLALSTIGVVSPSSKKQRVAKATMKNTAATARATQNLSVAASAAPAERLSPEQTIRIQVAAKHRKWIDGSLKDAGFRDRNERHLVHVQVVRLVGDGSSLDEAVDQVIKWRDAAEGVESNTPAELDTP
jgi:hypothetical protein